MVFALSGTNARANIVAGRPFYQNATLGATNQTGGAAISLQPPDQQWLGVRFQTSVSAVIDGVGGNLSVYNFFGNGDIFAALVQLTSLTDFPDSTELSSADVLATTTFTDTYPSTDAVIPIGPVTIGPGTYAVIFGSGLFGATGQGSMPLDNTPIGIQSVFEMAGNSWSDATLPGVRFTVYAAPEPGTIALMMLGGGAMGWRMLRRKR